MVNNFKAFAIDQLANVLDQASYEAMAALPLGFSAGIALSPQLNKAWRQSSVMASVLAQYIANQTGQDVLDNGDMVTLQGQLVASITIGSGIKPARIVTVSTALVIAIADYRVGLKRIAGAAVTAVTLPAGAQNGQEYVLEDLAKNFAAFPVTVSPPAGDNIAGDATFVCNVNKGSYTFARYAEGGTATWSVRS